MLDATTSAVTAEGNIYQKATELLKKYPRAIAIVVSGGQIEWRTEEPHPKNKQDRRGWGARRYKGKDKMFGVILEEIDASELPASLGGKRETPNGLPRTDKVPSTLGDELRAAASMTCSTMAQGEATGGAAEPVALS